MVERVSGGVRGEKTTKGTKRVIRQKNKEERGGAGLGKVGVVRGGNGGRAKKWEDYRGKK